MDSGQDKEKRPIPKFGSFKPKAPPPPPSRPTQRETEPEEPTRRRDRRKPTSDHVGNDEDASSRRRRRKHTASRYAPAHKPERSAEVEPLPQNFRHVSSQDDFYKLDPKGDPYNLTYGSLHKYDVPKYHRSGSGRVLGLGSKYRIDYELADGKSLVLRTFGISKDGGKAGNKDLWKRAAKGPRPRKLRRSSPVSSANDLERDFLSLTPNTDAKRRRLEDGSYMTGLAPSDEESLPSYRYTERKTPAHDIDTISDSGLESDDETARLENARLSRHVEEQPGDLRGWFKLIDHQKNLVGAADNEGRRKLTSAEKTSVADIKISIYERALKKIPPDIPRDRLLLGMMEESSTVWDKKTLANKWKALLESNPGYISLWIRYLDFQQTSFINFTYEKCRSVFQECLKVNQRSPDDAARNVINLYILLRFSLFMREAGYLEQSLAIWQAVLEFNFFHPQNLDLRRDSQTAFSSFSEFWESEVPRIGEEGAKGWHQAGGDAPDAKSDPTPPGIDGAAIFQSWVELEQDFMKHSSLPARTLDDVQEDDPYRVILYTDIEDFLIPFSSFGLSDLLIGAFLIYCHLPPHVSSLGDKETITNWHGDPFFCNHYLDESGRLSSQWFSSLVRSTADSESHQPFSFPQQTIGSGADTLFGNGQSWFCAFENWKLTYVDKASHLDVDWVLQCLKQLVAQMPNNDVLAEYTVAFESTTNPKGAKTYAKSLLRNRPACIRLYNAYALLEVRNDQMASAEKVLTTAISMSKSFPEAVRMDCILLWRTWVWEALDCKQYDKARMLLLAIPDNSIDPKALPGGVTSANPAEFLRSQRFLGDSQAHALSFRKSPVFSHCTDCLALLTYLTRGQDIDGAINVYKAAEQQLGSQDIDNKAFLEPIHQGKARLLYHHLTTSRIYKPSLIREELNKSISLFPQNTMFLSLLAFNESRFRIDDRVRSTLHQQLADPATDKDSTKHWTDSLGESTLIPHLFAIYTELHRGLAAGSTAHSARAAFESAVATRSGQCSAALWKLYIQFEIALNERMRAREVFFRSIRACPWAKGLVLLAFSEAGLRDEMNTDELRRVWNVLVEKELRIHIDLEEWFEENEEMADDSKGDMGQPPIIMPDDKSSDGEDV